MSRVGRKPITLPKGVEVKVDASGVHVKGPKGAVSAPVLEGISVAVKDGRVDLVRASEEKRIRAFHGLNRALVANAVLGGLGIAIVSTSQGLLTGHDARKRGLGGEVVCSVW